MVHTRNSAQKRNRTEEKVNHKSTNKPIVIEIDTHILPKKLVMKTEKSFDEEEAESVSSSRYPSRSRSFTYKMNNFLSKVKSKEGDFLKNKGNLAIQ